MSYLPSFDRQLVGRVRKYMSDHRTVMVDQMAEDLQQIYKHDYGRRKRNAFRKLVKQIHSSISAETKNKKLTEIEKRHLSKRRKEDSADDGSSDSLDELLMEYHDQNSINSSIMSMYKKQRKSNSTPSSPFRYYDSPDPNSKSKTQSKIEISKNDDDMCMKSEKFYFEERAGDASIKESETSPKLVSVNGELDTPQNFDFIKKDYSKPKRSKKKKTVTETKDVEITGEKAKPKFSFLSSSVTFSDVGGNEKTLKEVCNLLIHMKHPEIYQTLGVVPPCGILLHGPPGCGKSLLANAIAGELSLPMLKIAATEIVSGVSGDSEQKLREVFEMARSTTPCIVFIDEIDAITPKREIASKDMERRIVAQLIACLDDLNTSPCQILVIGATNRPDSIDPALRRAGRFDREVCMGIPDEKARVDILKVLCRKLKLETDFNYQMLARLTPGYVGADLMALCREAAMCAVNRILVRYHKESIQNGSTSEMGTKTNTIGDMNNNVFDSKKLSLSMEEMMVWLHQTASLTEEQLSELCFNFSDFEKALHYVQPSAKREGFATIPDVTWDDVGALEDVREELTVAILAPVRNPEAFAALGLTKPPGILLAGPPGCGKTLLAKAIANESGINFISVKGPELLNMYVGESERAVRQCFERARNSAPCVVFFDELDSLCPRRSGAESASTARVVNQMLTEMDGLETRGHVFVMAATNRPDIIDPAVLRPGRLDKTLYVSMPKAVDRLKILTTITRNGARPPLSDNVSLKQIADDTRCDRFTGADLSSLVREASVNALKEHISSEHIFQDDGLKILNVKVRMEHFETAFKKVKPSVSSKDEIKYEKMRIDLQT